VSFRHQDEQRKEFMKIWQQANPWMPKIPSVNAAKYNNKIDNIVNKLKTVDAQAREMTGRSSTVTEKAQKSEMGIAESMEGREISGEGRAGLTSQNSSGGWKSKTEDVFAALKGGKRRSAR